MSRGLLTPTADWAINAICPVNWLAPLNRGLVSWWLGVPGWTGGSKWPDLCNRNHGTLTNMDPAAAWKDASSRPGGFACLDFVTDDNVIVTNTPALATLFGADFTFSIWSIPDSGAGFPAMFYKGGNVDFGILNNGGTTDMRLDNTSVAVTSGCPVSVWTFHVVTRTGSAVAVYSFNPDTLRSNTGTIAGSGASSSNISIGRRESSDLPWDGRIDDVRVYDRGMALPEARQLYDASRTRYPSELNRVRRWAPRNTGGAPPATNRRRRLIIAGGMAA